MVFNDLGLALCTSHFSSGPSISNPLPSLSLHHSESKLPRSLVILSRHLDSHSYQLIVLAEFDCAGKVAINWIDCLLLSVAVADLESSQVSLAAWFLEDVDLLNRRLTQGDWLPAISFHAQHLWFLAIVRQFETCKIIVTSTPPTEGNPCDFHVRNIWASLELVNNRPALREFGYGTAIRSGFKDLAVAK